MKEDTYAAIAAYEQRFWWHRIRRQLVAGLLRTHGLPPGATAVDIGFASGGTSLLHDELGVATAVGIERSERSLALARQRSPSTLLVCADASGTLPLQSEQFDLASIFGVLNHEWISDERRVFGEVARVLKPGGLLVVTEPAFQVLMRGMDRYCMTKHRYQPGELAAMAAANGLEVVRQGHFAMWAFVPAWLLAMWERLAPRSWTDNQLPLDLREPPRLVNAVCYAVSWLEAMATLRGAGLPFGVTYFGLFRRPA